MTFLVIQTVISESLYQTLYQAVRHTQWKRLYSSGAESNKMNEWALKHQAAAARAMGRGAILNTLSEEASPKKEFSEQAPKIKWGAELFRYIMEELPREKEHIPRPRGGNVLDEVKKWEATWSQRCENQRVSRGWIRSNVGFSVSRVSNCELVSARKPWKIKSDRRKENKLDMVLKDLSVHGTNAGRLVGR